MERNTIYEIIQHSLDILEKEVELSKSSLRTVQSRSLKPISDFFHEKQQIYYSESLVSELEESYHKQMTDGIISRNIYNVRIRGIRIVQEVYSKGTYFWKGPHTKEILGLPKNFERIVEGVADTNCSERKNQEIQTIIRRFFWSLSNLGLSDVIQVEAEHIQMFLRDISRSRPKSMDQVICSLRKLDRYLTNSGMAGLPYVGLLMAPRARERKVYPCMLPEDLALILNSIDCTMPIGKRDYAILTLAANTGMRAGDIANIKLSDIDWRKNEIRIIQGKTQRALSLPLQRNVGVALVDYILNGRPESKSPQVFLRSLAPFQCFKDGVSVACVLRKHMKAAEVSHIAGDGKTMHGIRRMFGTQMTMEGVPITTIAQILGHQNVGSSKAYISLDIEGLRKCALGFSSLGEGLI
jgi:site-specific recombinase XerD